MHRLITAILAAFVALSTLGLAPPALAQNADSGRERRSGADRPLTSYGVALEVSSSLTSVAGVTSSFGGLRANWVVETGDRHRTYVGLAARALTTRTFDNLDPGCVGDHVCIVFETPSSSEAPTRTESSVRRRGATIDAMYGGLDVRYAYRLTDVLDVGGGVVAGPGFVTVDTGSASASDTFVGVAPEAGLTYRPVRFFAVTASTSYRFTPRVRIGNLSMGDFSGFSLTLGLQFGWMP